MLDYDQRELNGSEPPSEAGVGRSRARLMGFQQGEGSAHVILSRPHKPAV